MLIAWLMLVGVPLLSVAQEREFRVEVLVFVRSTLTDQRFEPGPSRIQWPQYWLDSSDFAPLLLAEQTLASVRQRLEQSRRYRVLKQWSFNQRIAPNQTGDAVRLLGFAPVEGFVRIRRGEYLELQADIEYQPSADQPRYRIDETRLIKFDQLNYFDHPGFGVLLRVR